MRMADPGRLEVRAVGDDQKNWQRLQALDRKREKLDRGRIAPLRVLEHHKQRPSTREDRELIEQCRQHLRALALRIAGARGTFTQAEKIGQGSDIGLGAEQLLKLGTLARRGIVAIKAGGVRQLRHDRLQRAALVMWQAKIA